MADPEALALLITSIKETLACIAIGGILGTAIWGITVLQTYIYYRRCGNSDRWPLKVLVGVLFLLDTATSALVAEGMYNYMVLYFNVPLDKYLEILPTLGAENGVTVVIATICQCFFAQRLWILSKNKVLVGIIVGLSVGALAPGMGITVDLFTERSIFSLGTTKTRILAGFANGMSALCDVIIAGGLWYHLRAERPGFVKTRNLVDRLMLYTIQRGALTAICQLMHMIMTVALPDHFLFLPFAFMQGKLYCNTLLATLNVRKSLKHGGGSDAHVLTPMSRDSHRDDRKGPFGMSTDREPTVVHITSDTTVSTISGQTDFDRKVAAAYATDMHSVV